jgi:hypothetical protein
MLASGKYEAKTIEQRKMKYLDYRLAISTTEKQGCCHERIKKNKHKGKGKREENKTEEEDSQMFPSFSRSFPLFFSSP